MKTLKKKFRKKFNQIEKIGLPPGSLIFTGEKFLEVPIINLYQYNQDELDIIDIRSIEDFSKINLNSKVSWLNIDGLHVISNIEKIGEIYGLHPLLLEDILNTNQRPKIDHYDNLIFIIVKMLSYDEASQSINAEQVSFILGEKFLITFQEGMLGDVFDTVRDRIIKTKGKVRKNGVDYLCYELLDSIIDNYFIVLEKLGDRLELIEEEAVSSPNPETLVKIHELKRELISIRKSVWPVRDITNKIEREESAFIDAGTKFYLRDLYDHSIQVIEAIETYRDTLSGLEDLYLSSLSNKMNEVMKVLTIITTIFIPLSFVAGVYGMNFKHMPELDWRFGYPLILSIMLLLGIGMGFFFKRKKWF